MHTLLQRFRRLAEEEVEEPDADWAASDTNDDSDDESHDGTFKPIYAFWAEKGMVSAKNMRGGGRRRPQARPAAANAGRKRRAQVVGCLPGIMSSTDTAVAAAKRLLASLRAAVAAECQTLDAESVPSGRHLSS